MHLTNYSVNKKSGDYVRYWLHLSQEPEKSVALAGVVGVGSQLVVLHLSPRNLWEAVCHLAHLAAASPLLALPVTVSPFSTKICLPKFRLHCLSSLDLQVGI